MAYPAFKIPLSVCVFAWTVHLHACILHTRATSLENGPRGLVLGYMSVRHLVESSRKREMPSSFSILQKDIVGRLAISSCLTNSSGLPSVFRFDETQEYKGLPTSIISSGLISICFLLGRLFHSSPDSPRQLGGWMIMTPQFLQQIRTVVESPRFERESIGEPTCWLAISFKFTRVTRVYLTIANLPVLLYPVIQPSFSHGC